MRSRQTLRRSMKPLLLAALLTLPAACSRNRNQSQDADVNDGPATIIFTNETLNQADLFAVLPGVQARKIGTVMAGRTEELVVPADIVRRSSNLNFVARLLSSSDAPGSGPVPLHAGDRLQVRLPMGAKTLFVAPASG